jgi:hypothetical protein
LHTKNLCIHELDSSLRRNHGNKKGAEAPSIGDLAFETSCRKFASTCRTLGLRLRAATFDLSKPILARPDAAFNRPTTRIEG